VLADNFDNGDYARRAGYDDAVLHMEVSLSGWKLRASTTLFLVLLVRAPNMRLAIRIESFLQTLLPKSLKLARRDVPIRPAFLANGPKVLAKWHFGRRQGCTGIPANG
jgi:hypothetical protein